MSCVICLTASADARRVCACSARVCRGCLVELLDRGKVHCVVCGSGFRSSAILKACRLASRNVDNDHDRAGRYVKLATAYSLADRPTKSLRTLAKAKRYAVPGSSMAHFIELETASNLLATGSAAEAEQCLMSVMDVILDMTDPITRSSAVLYAACCTLLCKTDIRFERLASATVWLQRAMVVQGEIGLESHLAASLQIEADILRREGKLYESKGSLMKAERIMMRSETDECLKCKLQVDIAITDAELGGLRPARARLCGVLPKLRKRKRDRCAKLLPIAAKCLALIVKPARRLRTKTWPERVECVES